MKCTATGNLAGTMKLIDEEKMMNDNMTAPAKLDVAMLNSISIPVLPGKTGAHF